MKDDTLRNLWPMGRITKAIKSEDGKVRKAEVMVYLHGEKKTYTRPIGELICDQLGNLYATNWGTYTRPIGELILLLNNTQVR